MPFLKKVLSTESLDLSKNTQNSLAQRSLGEAGSLRSQNSKGFTLIELLVVISIIGILAGIALVSYGGAQARSRDSKRKQDLKAIRNALQLAKQDTPGVYYYPKCDDSGSWCTLDGSITDPNLAPTYIKAVPLDPKSNIGYRYYPYNQYDLSCNNTNELCIKYKIISCMENANDPQKDNPKEGSCTTPASYTITPD